MNSGQCQSSSESAKLCPKGPLWMLSRVMPSSLTGNIAGKEALFRILSFLPEGVLLCCVSFLVSGLQKACILWPHKALGCHPAIGRLNA